MKKTKKIKQKTKVVEVKGRNKIVPLGDRVLVRPFTEEELKGNKKQNFGIILPDSMKEEKSAQGKVLAVGEGRYDDGQLVPMNVKAGDIVLFSKYSYDEVKVNDEELYLIKSDNILAKYE
ncbi:MAG: co-chaperone GroES [bacterium]|nr:co-chaperone GroES [bacterium]